MSDIKITESKVLSRKTRKSLGRKKRVIRLTTDREFAAKYFEMKSKKALGKKAAFRKKKARKK